MKTELEFEQKCSTAGVVAKPPRGGGATAGRPARNAVLEKPLSCCARPTHFSFCAFPTQQEEREGNTNDYLRWGVSPGRFRPALRRAAQCGTHRGGERGDPKEGPIEEGNWVVSAVGVGGSEDSRKWRQRRVGGVQQQQQQIVGIVVVVLQVGLWKGW